MATLMRRLWRRVFGVKWVVTDLTTGEVTRQRSRQRVTPEEFTRMLGVPPGTQGFQHPRGDHIGSSDDEPDDGEQGQLGARTSR